MLTTVIHAQDEAQLSFGKEPILPESGATPYYESPEFHDSRISYLSAFGADTGHHRPSTGTAKAIRSSCLLGASEHGGRADAPRTDSTHLGKFSSTPTEVEVEFANGTLTRRDSKQVRGSARDGAEGTAAADQGTGSTADAAGLAARSSRAVGRDPTACSQDSCSSAGTSSSAEAVEQAALSRQHRA